MHWQFFLVYMEEVIGGVFYMTILVASLVEIHASSQHECWSIR